MIGTIDGSTGRRDREQLAILLAEKAGAEDYRFGGSGRRSIGDVVSEEELNFERSDMRGLQGIMQNLWRGYVEGWYSIGVYVPADTEIQ